MSILLFLLAIFSLILIAWGFGFFAPSVPKQRHQPRNRPPRQPAPKVSPQRQRDTSVPKPTTPAPPVKEQSLLERDRIVTPSPLLRYKKKQTRKVSATHKKYILESQRVLKRLRRNEATLMQLPGAIAMLRRTNPYAFEELLLTCFEEQSWQIQRNFRYSADGGLDGRVTIAGKLYVVQAKRYSGYIKPQHVQEFQLVIRAEGAAGGFFIHSGITGEKSKEFFRNSQTYLLISGEKLVNFVLGQKLRIIGVTIPISSKGGAD